MKSIAMANGQDLIRTYITEHLERSGEYKVTISASSGSQLITQLENSPTLPDLCIIGSAPEGMYGFATIQQLTTKWPQLKTMTLTASKSPYTLMFMMHLGICACVNTNCQPQELKETLDDVCSGYSYFPQKMKDALNIILKQRRAPKTGISIFSNKEYEIMVLLCRQHLAKEIASKLKIKKSTIDTHIQAIYGKLGIHKSNELLLLLKDAGFEME